jgi:hypothetical protein
MLKTTTSELLEDPLVIQKILSHLNTKNDDVVELLPHKVEHRLR